MKFALLKLLKIKENKDCISEELFIHDMIYTFDSHKTPHEGVLDLTFKAI
jgi:hypothetical protein